MGDIITPSVDAFILIIHLFGGAGKLFWPMKCRLGQ
jgi:hypothetical protein